MTDSTVEPNGPGEDPRDEGPTDTNWEMIASLTNALQHIDASLDDLTEGVANIINKLGAIHSQGKRVEAALTRIEKAIDGDPPDESRAGF
jgi:hypothetical protein